MKINYKQWVSDYARTSNVKVDLMHVHVQGLFLV